MSDSLRNFFPISGWPIALIILVTQFLASYLVNLLSYNKLYKLYPLFRTRKWENKGAIYQTVFKIKSWKDFIPSISSFDKKNVKPQITPEYVSQFLLEGLRAELCHLFAIIFAFIILLISIPSAWFFIVVYTLLINLPCLIIQRYNRPRFEQLLRKRDEKGNIIFNTFWIKDGKPSTAHEEKKERHLNSSLAKMKQEEIKKAKLEEEKDDKN